MVVSFLRFVALGEFYIKLHNIFWRYRLNIAVIIWRRLLALMYLVQQAVMLS